MSKLDAATLEFLDAWKEGRRDDAEAVLAARRLKAEPSQRFSQMGAAMLKAGLGNVKK